MKPGRSAKAGRRGAEILPLPGAKREAAGAGARKRPKILLPAVLAVAVLAGAMLFLKPGEEGADPFSGPAGPPPKAAADGDGTTPAGGTAGGVEGAAGAGGGGEEAGTAEIPDVKASLPGTADEALRRQAENDIRVGDDYYDESQVEWANLYKAIQAWRRAQNTLGKFEVRPDYYPEIGRKIAKAEAELNGKIRFHTAEARRLYRRWSKTGDRPSFNNAFQHMNVIRLLVPETTDPRNKNAIALMEKMRSAYERSQ
jgi:hypothetical protein